MGVFGSLRRSASEATQWPLPADAARINLARRMAAHRDSDRAYLLPTAESLGAIGRNAQHRKNWAPGSMAQKISMARARMLFGEQSIIRAADLNDQIRLDEIIAENELHATLYEAAITASSEGEVWFRVSADPDLVGVPIIESISTTRIYDIKWRGRVLVSAMLLIDAWKESGRSFRLFERHSKGHIEYELYNGSENELGTRMNLESHSKTRGMVDVEVTGIDRPLLFQVKNRKVGEGKSGRSDYEAVEMDLFNLYEIKTLMQANARVAGPDRVIVPEELLPTKSTRSATQQGMYFDPTMPVQVVPRIIDTDDLSGAGATGTRPEMKYLQAEFDAEKLLSYKSDIEDDILSGCGLTREALGQYADGATLSGTAIRHRLNSALLDAEATGRHFDAVLVKVIKSAIELDARPIEQGGFGQSWTSTDAPSITRGDGLANDTAENATTALTMFQADSASLDTRVRLLHPDWTDEQVAQEVERIQGDDPLGLSDLLG